jgi:predicted nucleic acid-binding Zn finger protein
MIIYERIVPGIIFLILGIANNEVFFIIIGGGIIIYTIYWFVNLQKNGQTILKHGYEGTAKFTRSIKILSKNRCRYLVYYEYTDENDEYHEVEASGFYTYDQSDNIKAFGYFPIKYIGKESVPLVNLRTLARGD